MEVVRNKFGFPYAATDTPVCSGCPYLGSDSAPPDVVWSVCDHPKFKDEYEDGRAQDFSYHDKVKLSPDWCPL